MPACTWHSPTQMFCLRPVDLLEPQAQVHVGQEEDFLVLRDRPITAWAFPDVQQ